MDQLKAKPSSTLQGAFLLADHCSVFPDPCCDEHTEKVSAKRERSQQNVLAKQLIRQARCCSASCLATVTARSLGRPCLLQVGDRIHIGLDNSSPCMLSMSPAVALQYTPALSQPFDFACHDSLESCGSSTDSRGQPAQAHLLTNPQAASEQPILSGVFKYRQVAIWC